MTALEYLTAVLLEKLFKAKWWDYSKFPLNYQGRIGLISSLIFGVMCVLLIRYIHPFTKSVTDRLPLTAKKIFVLVFLLYVLTDIAVTIRHVLILNGRLDEIQCAINGFLGKYRRRAGELKNAILVNFEESEFYSDRIKTLFSLDRLQNRRIFRAFPTLRSLRYDDALKKLRSKLLGTRTRARRRRRIGRLLTIDNTAPAAMLVFQHRSGAFLLDVPNRPMLADVLLSQLKLTGRPARMGSCLLL